VDGTRPFEDRSKPQAVENGLTMMTLIDLDARNGMTMALVGQRIELTVAAILSGAINEFASLDLPRSHAVLPDFEVLDRDHTPVPAAPPSRRAVENCRLWSSLLYRDLTSRSTERHARDQC
jgi:hypothetical protein